MPVDGVTPMKGTIVMDDSDIAPTDLTLVPQQVSDEVTIAFTVSDHVAHDFTWKPVGRRKLKYVEAKAECSVVLVSARSQKLRGNLEATTDIIAHGSEMTTE